MQRQSLFLAVLILALSARVTPLEAASCSVPGSHGTVLAAVEDPSCTQIALAAQVYDESVAIARSLSLAGPSGAAATLRGLLRIEGAGTLVTVSALRIENGCQPEAMIVEGSSEVETDGVTVVNSTDLPCPATVPGDSDIFADDFELGDTSKWSAVKP